MLPAYPGLSPVLPRLLQGVLPFVPAPRPGQLQQQSGALRGGGGAVGVAGSQAELAQGVRLQRQGEPLAQRPALPRRAAGVPTAVGSPPVPRAATAGGQAQPRGRG